MYKNNLLKISLIIFFFLVLFFKENSYAAYTSVSLSPSSGNITKTETKIDLMVNSGSDEFIGIDLDISFTGPVEFVRGVKSKCGEFKVTPGTGKINIECFNMSGDTHNGLVATLYFKATGVGESVFSISNVDPTSSTSTGGRYTLVLSSPNPNPNPDPNPQTPPRESSGLPSTGLFDSGLGWIIYGVILISSSAIIFPSKKLSILGRDKRRNSFEKGF